MSRSYRKERLDERLWRELNTIIGYELSDPRLAEINVSRVDVSRDLQTARVYISPLTDDQDERGILAGLENATGFIRMQIANRIELRRVPELVFRIDRSLQEARRVDAILDTLAHTESAEGERPAPASSAENQPK